MQGKSINSLYKTFVMRLQVIHPTREAEQLSEWLLMHQMGLNRRADFVLRKTDIADQHLVEKSHVWLKELLKGVPIQHLIGEVEFAGLHLKVNNDVLIPRPETEELVDGITKDLPQNFSGNILDIGTGSGCIALGLKNFFHKAKVIGLDVSESALEMARKNALLNQLEVDFLLKDILIDDTWTSQPLDVIVSNPPYIPIEESSQMSPTVADYEPSLALFTPNDDPLVFYKAIHAFASKYLNKHGLLYFELHESYAFQVFEMIEAKWPLAHVELIEDLQGKKRFLKAQV